MAVPLERIRYHALFDCDVREAALWYDGRSPGLGDAFVEAVRKRVDDVIINPDRYTTTTHGCRYARVTRFPYIVLYDFSVDELLLLGVLHTARSIEKWRERRLP